MNIHDAVLKAKQIDGYITRQGDRSPHPHFIKPTDGYDCCRIHLTMMTWGRGWQPQEKDLLADDWVALSQKDCWILSRANERFDEQKRPDTPVVETRQKEKLPLIISIISLLLVLARLILDGMLQ